MSHTSKSPPPFAENGPHGGGPGPLILYPVVFPPLPTPPIPEWALAIIAEAHLHADPAMIKRALDEYLAKIDAIGIQYQETLNAAGVTYLSRKAEADQALRSILLRS